MSVGWRVLLVRHAKGGGDGVEVGEGGEGMGEVGVGVGEERVAGFRVRKDAFDVVGRRVAL